MTVLAALAAHYERLAARGRVAPVGYAPTALSFVVEIDASGEVIDFIDMRLADKKRSPRMVRLPKLRDHNNSGADPFLFWDNTGYALGVVKKAMKRGSPKALFDHFRERHERELAGTDDPGLLAFLAFLRRWSPTQFAEPLFTSEALDRNIAFRLERDQEFLHDRLAAREIWARVAAPNGEQVRCMVTGRIGPMRRLHPKFKTLTGTQNAPIVSFEGAAFQSYGKDQGANAPTIDRTASEYGAALGHLLDRNSGRNVLIGDATIVYWADAREVGETAAEAVEETWGAAAFDPDRGVETQKLRAAVETIASGRPSKDLAPDLDPRTRVHLLGLFSPNSGRIGVRFWHVGTFGELAMRLMEHWEDLALGPDPFAGRLPSPWRLVMEIAVHVAREEGGTVKWVRPKDAKPPPRIGGELLTAILTGRRYPRTLLENLVMRVRAERGRVTGSRAALIKAVINRPIRIRERETGLQLSKEKLPVSLDPDSDDVAYNLGRLFAAYAYAENSFNPRGATIRDKYMGAASATPRRVFPILMRGYEHNRSGLAKTDGQKRGAGVKADKAVSQIIGRYDGDVPFPPTLRLEEQGRFFVGYYHQERAFYSGAKPENAEANENADTAGTED